MLAMKKSCERCCAPLLENQAGAFICSYECTFCERCTHNDLAGQCPNCFGQLVLRPTRKIPTTIEEK